MSNITTGIVGMGFVGSAIYKSFKLLEVNVNGYDKYNDRGDVDSLDKLLNKDILFLCLPTLFSYKKNEYDKSAIEEVCKSLSENKYNGLVVIKSTLEPEFCEKISNKYLNLNICHNPEFLTARTAFTDFHSQEHIVLGKTENCELKHFKKLEWFYKITYPSAEISLCSSTESESMKIFVNSFYASKIQLFNEYYLLCQNNGSDYNKIVKLMLKNKWINPMHTMVPGTDGKLSYGGACFPKDTNALSCYMEKKNVYNKVLKSVIEERNLLRQNDLKKEKQH